MEVRFLPPEPTFGLGAANAGAPRLPPELAPGSILTGKGGLI
jgi:hypothetical protein